MTDQTHESSSSLQPEQEQMLDLLADALHAKAQVGVLCGAGISAASGVPTFRGEGGLWKEYRAEDLATPEAFARDPRTVWEWYGWRRELIAKCQPNPAHDALSELARHVNGLGIITQNVDGLHALSLENLDLAGLPSGLPSGHVELVEIHGSIWHLRCTQCDHEREDRSPGPPPGEMPKCECGGLLRPGVVWFGEMLPHQGVERAAAIASNCDVFLVIGTAAVVYPAASYAALAARADALVAEFNLEATPLSQRLPIAVHAPAEISLPALLKKVRERRA